MHLRWLVLIGFIVLSGSVFAADIEFSAAVDRTTMTQDDVLTYTVTVRSSKTTGLRQPELPGFEGFQIVGGPSSSTQISMVNFQTTASLTTTLQLLPLSGGDLVIQPATYQDDGKEYKTESFTIKIVAGGAQPPQPQVGAQQQAQGQPPPDDQEIPVYVTAVADKERVYLGEQVTVEYTLYNRASIANLNIQSLPGTTGFWVEDLESPQRLTANPAMIQGKRYEVALLKRLALFPNLSGAQVIDPMVLQVAVRLQRQRGGRQGRSPFDNIMDDFWSDAFAEVKNIVRKSPSLNIEVLPLPQEGRPANFGGTVGNFDITASIDKREVPRGQAVSLHVVITGTGSIKTAANPVKPEIEGFRVYDPTVEERSWIQGRQYAGEKKIEYVLIPKKEGVLTIPALEYSFFDPAAQSYQTKKTQPLTLKVLPGAEPEEEDRLVVSSADKKEVVVRTKDIRYIKGISGAFEPQLDNLNETGLPWLFFLPILVLPASYLVTKRKIRYSEDRGFARKKRAQAQAGRYLSKAEAALKKRDPKTFYDALTDALIGFVADKLNQPKPALTTDTLMLLLREQKTPDDRCSELRELLLQADIARFTPSNFDQATMQQSLKSARDWLNAMIKAKYLEVSQ